MDIFKLMQDQVQKVIDQGNSEEANRLLEEFDKFKESDLIKDLAKLREK
jgi:hypothetical protein